MKRCTALIMVWESGIIKNLLLKTCDLIHPYFNKIVIFHCGPSSQMFLYDEYKHIPNIHIEKCDFNGEVDSVLKKLSTFIPMGEWGLFLDSDHRPTESFLLNLESNIELLEKNNCNYGGFPTVPHVYSDDDICKVEWGFYPVPTHQSECCYIARILVRMHEGFEIYTNKGMHYSFFSNTNMNMLYLPYGIGHFKLNFEMHSSLFLSGYTEPRVHAPDPDNNPIEILNSKYYEEFNNLKKKYNMITSNDFKERAYAKTIPQEFFDFFSNENFLKEKNSNTTIFLNSANIFCTKYRFKFDQSFTNKRYCGNSCCIYNGEQY
jgi:hypothetical protein